MVDESTRGVLGMTMRMRVKGEEQETKNNISH